MPRKRRAPKLRIEPAPPLLRSVRALLLFGRGDARRRTYAGDADRLAPYRLSQQDLVELWHRHRAELEDEAAALGIVPWAATLGDGTR